MTVSDNERIFVRRLRGNLHMSIDKGLYWAQGIMLLVLFSAQLGNNSVHLLHQEGHTFSLCKVALTLE